MKFYALNIIIISLSDWTRNGEFFGIHNSPVSPINPPNIVILQAYSDKCRTKKAFKYVKKMLPLFRAVVKFCSINRLFTS